MKMADNKNKLSVISVFHEFEKKRVLDEGSFFRFLDLPVAEKQPYSEYL